MPEAGTDISVQELAAIIETMAEMMRRQDHYPTPGFVRMARANRDILKRAREMGDAGTYNALTAAERQAWIDERDLARQEHRQTLADTAAAFGQPAPVEPADEET